MSDINTEGAGAPAAGIDKSFMGRVRANKPTRWVRFSLVMVLYLLWVAWMGDRKSVV